MMNVSVSIESQPGLNSRIERRVAFARAIVFWERLWPRLWPASGIFGVLLALALLDVLPHLPLVLHACALIACFGSAGYFLVTNLHGLRWPEWREGARRVERESTVLHRPITERYDRLVAGQRDPFAEALWRTHMRALLARHDRLRFARPGFSLAGQDPYFLRYAVLVVLVAGLLASGADAGRRLGLAFSLERAMPLAALDAWIDPPAYTGEAPVYLPRGDRSTTLSVPAGSMLGLRVHGRVVPQLSLVPRLQHKAAFLEQAEDYSANAKITRDESVGVTAGGQSLGSWRIRAVPDEPPSAAFAQPPSRTERDAVKFAFTAGDDYGVTSARVIIHPLSARKGQRALVLELPLSSVSKTISDTVYRDLTADPYAGLPVTATLEVKDAVGHVGRSVPVDFTLPSRVFTNLLSRALIEQRQNLSMGDLPSRNTAALALDALALAPDAFYPNQSSVYLAIRAAFWALKQARNTRDLVHVQDLLWQTAIALERGGLSSAAQELRRLQELLSQALAQGAPQPVIDSLLQRYKQALNRYLEMLAKNPPPPNAPPPPKNAKTLRPQDLQALLNAIQQLAQTGARAQAQQMLAMLQGLLENLHMTAGSGGGQQGDKSLSDALKGLGDLMGKQRQLLDKTFREQQGNPNPKEGGPKGLSQEQGNLREQLDKLVQGLGPKAGGKHLGEAGKQMGEAQGKLGERALDNAADAERKALDALRKGAGQLAQELMRQGDGKQGEAGNEDPLGRDNGGRGASFGDQTKLPSKSALERARSILKELRRRAEERGRPKEELDYIDRLLKQF
ncbi:MAG: DUF4175 family protein [Alphaproteobacteria bacterium]|nr:DUF4175 family protein [Alphaproteobacteria bacterium]